MTGLEIIELPDGTVRRLGNIMPPAGLTRAWKIYGDTPNTPMRTWEEIDAAIAASPGPEDDYVQYVHDQDGVGQCNCDATAGAAEAQRARQGLDFVKLSAADLYDRINGGSDRGSLLEDALQEMTTRGIGTADTAGLIWKRGMRTAPDSERGRFRALEAFLCPTFQHVASAGCEGFDLISGISWASNYTPDGEGWLPKPRGNAGGHAIHGYKPTKRGNTRGIWHQNSWGPGWGLQGRFVIPEWCYDQSIGGWWAIRVMVDEGGKVPLGK